jgi:hypothetical protein
VITACRSAAWDEQGPEVRARPSGQSAEGRGRWQLRGQQLIHQCIHCRFVAALVGIVHAVGERTDMQVLREEADARYCGSPTWGEASVRYV